MYFIFLVFKTQAPLKPFHSNLPDDQVAALKELKKEQDKRIIVIKPKEDGQNHLLGGLLSWDGE